MPTGWKYFSLISVLFVVPFSCHSFLLMAVAVVVVQLMARWRHVWAFVAVLEKR
jgi:hypothetical protein